MFAYGNSSFTLRAGGGGGAVAPVPPGSATTAVASSSVIDLSWQDLSDNETEFRVNRQVAGGSWLELVRLDAGVTAYSDTGLDAETEYCYEVIASNAVGDSPASGATCATTDAAGVAPAEPGNVTATEVSSSGIDVAWVDSSDNEDEFRVERRRAGGAWRARSVLAANTTSLADRVLNDDTRYCYRVPAVNAFGNSATSSVACARTSAVAQPPRTPRRLRIARRYVGGIDLTWRDRSSNETGFNVYRKLKRGGAWQLVGTAPANRARFSDTSVSRRKRYCYVVRAANGSGESSSSNRRCTRAR